ncbi:MAG: MMPL family transporter [Pseudomonadales bacterium]|nr:MMPL family transporter [Pseudomonadales bacterium]
MPELTHLLYRYPKMTLLLSLCLIMVFAFIARDVRLSNNFASLFAMDNHSNDYRHFYRQQFGADDGVLIAVIDVNQISPALTAELIRATEKLELQPEIERVISIANSSIMHNDNDSLSLDPVFFNQDPLAMPADQFAENVQLLRQSAISAGRLLATDKETLLIYAQLPIDYDSFAKVKQPAAKFRQIIEQSFLQPHFSSHEPSLYFAGIAFTRIGILTLMRADLFLLVPLTALVLAILLFYVYRSFSVVWISLLATVFSITATLAVIGINNDNINQLTVTFPVLLMVIVVANGIHFFHRYVLELQNGKSKPDAIRIMTEQVSKATLLSCLTTAIGFFALMTADMPILHSFGVYLGAGVLLSFVGLIVIIPSGLYWLQPELNYHMPSWLERVSRRNYFMSVVQALSSKPWRLHVLLIASLLLISSAFIASKASYDYYLKDMLDTDHPQIKAGEFLDKHLSGALPLEISLLAKPGDFKRADVLQRQHAFTEWLANAGIDASALSLASVIAELNRAMLNQPASRFPDSDAHIAQLLLLLESSEDQIVSQLVDAEFSHARIKANIPDVGAVAVMQLKQQIETAGQAFFHAVGVEVTLTGELPVAYEGMNKLTEELIQSVLVALIFIVITIACIFRDWRLVLAGIFPNILPIVMGMALYSLSGQGINPLPGIAFCIAIGIAVDDTVHLFARYNEELQRKQTRQQAAVAAVQAVKGALFCSSCILSIGFLLFLLSGFTWNRDLGLLGAFLIVSALWADLLITPPILAMASDDQADNCTGSA